MVRDTCRARREDYVEVAVFVIRELEEDFEYIVAVLLPCPRSFFKLAYYKHGELVVIFTPRPESIANHKRYAWLGWPGYCSFCSSEFSEKNSRIAQGTVLPPGYVDYGRFRFCMACYDTKMPIHLQRDAPNLNRHERVYVDRMNMFMQAADNR